MKVDLDEFEKAQRVIDRVNSVPLNEIEWYRGRKRIEPPPGTVEEWKFIGLSNATFAHTILIEENGDRPEQPAS